MIGRLGENGLNFSNALLDWSPFGYNDLTGNVSFTFTYGETANEFAMNIHVTEGVGDYERKTIDWETDVLPLFSEYIDPAFIAALPHSEEFLDTFLFAWSQTNVAALTTKRILTPAILDRYFIALSKVGFSLDTKWRDYRPNQIYTYRYQFDANPNFGVYIQDMATFKEIGVTFGYIEDHSPYFESVFDAVAIGNAGLHDFVNSYLFDSLNPDARYLLTGDIFDGVVYIDGDGDAAAYNERLYALNGFTNIDGVATKSLSDNPYDKITIYAENRGEGRMNVHFSMGAEAIGIYTSVKPEMDTFFGTDVLADMGLIEFLNDVPVSTPFLRLPRYNTTLLVYKNSDIVEDTKTFTYKVALGENLSNIYSFALKYKTDFRLTSTNGYYEIWEKEGTLSDYQVILDYDYDSSIYTIEVIAVSK
jgi:hypothetical protein